MASYLWLIPLGVTLGVFGTLIGAGWLATPFYCINHDKPVCAGHHTHQPKTVRSAFIHFHTFWNLHLHELVGHVYANSLVGQQQIANPKNHNPF